MDGIVAISQRMAAIQATMSSFQPVQQPASGTMGASLFGDALAQAVGETSTATAATTTPAASTGSWTSGVPSDLLAYGNGNVPREALATVGQTGHRLWAPAATALEQVIADAAKDGVTIGVTDSYRSYDAQVDVAERKGLYTEGGLAAQPGTSPHGWGIAADLDLDAAGQAWMRANGGRYGFVEDTPREPWHWVYRK
ncbi:D-alanyl-D-alanine carboxypeptidase [Sanguibacter keddieii DSM 10542]|uniref:D-alanyl-D-alanine carboxypeptidase n=1 Tax=Sanguibacter keddieii (strain ATCC 51767 / DSM 10542 / NCFB 3025 / ST-74) TaxID=446469 RepID=D1BFD6_SANKS|nr:M15 family metallopeptidase [Sanguibacter keddieii]ACZ23439.1 D-alanyl-D-alanine carboxypeptidase [Sanguibacter keddieii DSM 10542]